MSLDGLALEAKGAGILELHGFRKIVLDCPPLPGH